MLYRNDQQRYVRHAWGRRGVFQTRIRARIPSVVLLFFGVALLTLFQLARPLLERQSPVHAPVATGGEPVPALSARLLAMDVHEAFSLDGQKIAPGALSQTLSEVGRSSPQPVLRLKAAKGLPFGEVRRVISLARGAGIADIRLEVESVNDAAGGRP